MVLGRFSQDRLPPSGDPEAQARERALDALYERAYEGRGVREADGDDFEPDGRQGGLGPGRPSVPEWVASVRDLFPRETSEQIERHALERFGLTELLTDPDFLERVEPDPELLAQALAFVDNLHGPAKDAVRRLCRRIVEDLRRKLEPEVRRRMTGRIQRFRHGPTPSAAAFDVRGTVRRNLRRWDPERRQLGIDRPRFFARDQRRLPWHVLLVVDQSASMLSSVIHAAVMGAIWSALPTLSVKLVLFDVAVVDASAHVDDPTEVLLGVQLGGGTDIGRALTYAESLIEDPHRTALVLITDFEEGAEPAVAVSVTRRLAGAGVKLLGLAALDDEARPAYDEQMAARLVDAGMQIGALTPGRLAEWLVGVMR